jgi:hypothetical protein
MALILTKHRYPGLNRSTNGPNSTRPVPKAHLWLSGGASVYTVLWLPESFSKAHKYPLNRLGHLAPTGGKNPSLPTQTEYVKWCLHN